MTINELQEVLNRTAFLTSDGYTLVFSNGNLLKGNHIPLVGQVFDSRGGYSHIGKYRIKDTTPPIEGVFDVLFTEMKEEIPTLTKPNIVLKYKAGKHISAVIFNLNFSGDNELVSTEI